MRRSDDSLPLLVRHWIGGASTADYVDPRSADLAPWDEALQ